MKELFLFGALIDLWIMWYTVYFLNKVRHFPCIKQKMGADIYKWSWVIVFCGSITGVMPYYSLRAIYHGFDCTTIIASFFQFLVFIYAFKLILFHIKTTRHEKRII
jgi:hypothetical protein